MSTQPTTDLVIDTLVPGSVKAAMKEVGASSSDLWMVPYKDIRVIEGFNVRVRNAEYEAHLHSIRDSILANGFYRDKPLEGYVAKEDGTNVIYITGGHTRYEAAGLAIEAGAAIEALPIIVKPAGTSQEDLTVALVTGNSGRPLTPIETAIVIKRLLGFGLDEKQIAQRLGYGKKYVEDLLSFFGLNTDVRAGADEEVIEISIPSTHLNAFLIGQRGDTLRQFQYLVSTTLRNKDAELYRVILDIADYKRQRNDRLRDQAEEWVKKVRDSGETMSLRPMSAAERRVVHQAVSDYSDVETHSEGEGRDRHIVLSKKTESDE